MVGHNTTPGASSALAIGGTGNWVEAALEVLFTARRRARNVRDGELAAIRLDNIVNGEWLGPSLTTVHVEGAVCGRRAGPICEMAVRERRRRGHHGFNIDEFSASPLICLHDGHEFLRYYRHELFGKYPGEGHPTWSGRGNTSTSTPFRRERPHFRATRILYRCH